MFYQELGKGRFIVGVIVGLYAVFLLSAYGETTGCDICGTVKQLVLGRGDGFTVGCGDRLWRISLKS